MYQVFEILFMNVVDWIWCTQVYLLSIPVYLILGLVLVKIACGEVTVQSFAGICVVTAANLLCTMVVYLAFVIACVVVPLVLFGMYVWPKIKDKKLL